jgi:hypothetical protein
MTFLLRVLVGCGNIPRRSGDYFENGGKTHILPQGYEERANVAILEGPLNWSETIRCNMWKLMSKVRTSLHKIEKLRNSIILQIFDYSQSGSVKGGELGCS